MKSIVYSLATSLLTTIAFSQKVEVPESVLKSFASGFPQATQVKWEKEHGNFEAEFKLNKTEQSALFDANGKLLETEFEIAVNALPKSVLAYVEAHYKSAKIKEAAKIVDAKGTLTYEAEIKGKDLIFDSSGKFIKAN